MNKHYDSISLAGKQQTAHVALVAWLAACVQRGRFQAMLEGYSHLHYLHHMQKCAV
ncbi:MAG TPA: hypothetical protein VGS41_01440 [Chthonomonadales bacterium]|nr:hypothetical protein [Chthonomonadales bacterium]